MWGHTPALRHPPWQTIKSMLYNAIHSVANCFALETRVQKTHRNQVIEAPFCPNSSKLTLDMSIEVKKYWERKHKQRSTCASRISKSGRL